MTIRRTKMRSQNMKVTFFLLLLFLATCSVSFAQDDPITEPDSVLPDTTGVLSSDTLNNIEASETTMDELPVEDAIDIQEDVEPPENSSEGIILDIEETLPETLNTVSSDEPILPGASEISVADTAILEDDEPPINATSETVQEEEVVQEYVYDLIEVDSTNYLIGLNYIPSGVNLIWQSIIHELTLASKYKEYIAEGGYAISQLGDLIMTLDGLPPEPGQKNWANYNNLHSRLINIIDMVQLAIILDSPEIDSSYTIQELEKKLEQYVSTKSELSEVIRTEQLHISQEAAKLLRKQERDPYYLQYHHRRNVIAHLTFRQAELVLNEARESFSDEYEAYFETLAELLESDPIAASKLKAPVPDYRKAKSIYRDITEKFPTSLFADDALYNLAYLTAEGGQIDAANRLYETFLRLYPKSEYTLNVLRRVASYYFDPPLNRPETATKYYSRIVNEFSDSTKYYIEAHYYLGWCYYRISDMPKAVESFAQTLDNAHATRGSVREDAFRYEDEAIQYIGICFSVDTLDWKGSGVDSLVAWLDYYPERNELYGREIVIRLGNIYNDQMGQYAKAIDAYDKFVEFFGNDPRGPEVQQKIVEIFREGRVYNLERTHFQKMIFFNDYNPDSEWWKVNTDASIREAVAPVLEQYLNEYIDETRITAYFEGDVQRSTPKASDVDTSQLYGRQYLRYWPRGPNAYKIHSDLAVDLEQLHRDMEAIREYWQVATLYPDTTKKELACMRVVAIAQEFVDKERIEEVYVNEEGALLSPDQKPEVIEEVPEVPSRAVIKKTISDSLSSDTLVVEEEIVVDDTPKITDLLHSEEMLLAGFDMYIEFYPATNNTPVMLYRAGELLDQHNYYPESRPYFEKLIAEYPEHKFIESAWGKMLEGHFKGKEYHDVELVADRIAETDVSEGLKEQAYKRKAAAILGYAQQLQAEAELMTQETASQEKYLSSAAEFVRVAMTTPDIEYAHQMLFQGGMTYVKGKDYVKANEAFLLLVERYPNSEYSNKALYYVGLNQQNFLNEPIIAARTFERLVKEYPASEFIQGAIRDASYNYGLAAVNDSLENNKQYNNDVIRVNEKYIELYPEAEDASAFLFENASHYLKLDRFEEANAIYQRYASRYPDDPLTVRAYFERGKYYYEHDNRFQASTEFKATIEAHDRLTEKGINVWIGYASRSLSLLLEWEHAEYDQLKFSMPQSSLQSAKSRKRDWRNALVDKYKKLVEYGTKDGYQAHYAIGRLDEELALATFYQELPTYDSLSRGLTVLIDSVVLPASDYNDLAVFEYRAGMTTLKKISEAVTEELGKRKLEMETFSELIQTLDSQDSTISVTDSTAKLTNLKKLVTYLDSAKTEAQVWSDMCYNKIPVLAFRKGEFFDRFWRDNFKLTVAPQNTIRELVRAGLPRVEAEMLLRQGLINSISPITPEACGVYLQAQMTAKNAGFGKEWSDTIETAFSNKVDSLLVMFRDQVQIANDRVDYFANQYRVLLTDPDGEDAESPDGHYPDEFEGLILEKVDYFNANVTDYTFALRGVLDTLATYKNSLPIGFGDKVISDALQFILDQYLKFKDYQIDAKQSKIDYTAKFDEEGEFQFDDAAAAFEEFELTCADYGLVFLEEGLVLKDDYNISGEGGISILQELVSIDPEKYAARVGLNTQNHVEFTSTDWKVYWEGEFGYETVAYEDSLWIEASISKFPDTVRVGIPIPEETEEALEDEFDTEEAFEDDFAEEDDTLLVTEDILETDELSVMDGEQELGGIVIDVDILGVLIDSLKMYGGDSLEIPDDLTAIWHDRKPALELKAQMDSLTKAFPDTVNIDPESLTILVDQDYFNGLTLDELIDAGYSPEDFTPDMDLAPKTSPTDAITPDDLSGILNDVLGDLDSNLSDSLSLAGTEIDSLAIPDIEPVHAPVFATQEEVEAALDAQREAVRDSIENAAIDLAWVNLRQRANEAISERDSILTSFAEQDSIWKLWNEPNEEGERTYWFRYSFDSYGEAPKALVWLDGGDDYTLHVNGELIDPTDINPDVEQLQRLQKTEPELDQESGEGEVPIELDENIDGGSEDDSSGEEDAGDGTELNEESDTTITSDDEVNFAVDSEGVNEESEGSGEEVVNDTEDDIVSSAEPIQHDIGHYLTIGENTIAIAVTSSDISRSGLLFGLVHQEGERINVVSSEDWLVSGVEDEGYQTADFDDSEWKYSSITEEFSTGQDQSTSILIDTLQASAIWFQEDRPDMDLVMLPVIPDTTTLDTSEVLLMTDISGVDTLGQAAADTRLGEINDENYEKLIAARKVAIYREKAKATDIAVEDEKLRRKEEWAILEQDRIELQEEIDNAEELWDQWMATDENGARSYWFRRVFNIDARPSAGHIYLTADDDLNLYLNGEYILADDQDSVDWMAVKEFDVGAFLKEGDNLIALEVTDSDNTRNGILVGLVYKTIPDIETALAQMKEDMLKQQDAERVTRLETIEKRELLMKIVLSPEELIDLRVAEKNKLR